MTLENAIDEAEKQKAKWEKFRGSEITNFIWYVVTFNNEYIINTTTDLKRYPKLKPKIVYDTNIGFYRKN